MEIDILLLSQLVSPIPSPPSPAKLRVFLAIDQAKVHLDSIRKPVAIAVAITFTLK